MREILLLAVVLIGLVATLRYPFSGVLLWTWFTCMQPHQGAFGYVQSAPLNYVIAIVTLAAWLFSKERKVPPVDATLFLLIAFLFWITVNGFFAVDPNWSWPLWNRTWKTIALGLVISAMATNKIRVHALVWAAVGSILYYGIKGGIFTLLSGGHSHVFGPAQTFIGDNNQLAAVTLMVLPLANYLRLHSANRWISRGFLAAIAISTVSVLGSYSRGAFIALGGLGVVAWFRSRRVILYPVVVAIVLVPALYFMPASYYERLNTIGNSDPDGSVHGRLVAWQVAWKYANDHFPMGNGFSGSELPPVFNHYFPLEIAHAAHNIFFEVLGDNGFIGLGLYLAIMVYAFVNCSRIRRATRGRPEYAWAFDLASMLQLSLIAFCLAGSALSLAYYDLFFVWVGVLSAMRVILKDVKVEAWRFARKPDPAVTRAPLGATPGEEISRPA
jgi:probable O-glycosylation ligase (exosortase A-associated)